MSLTIKQEKFCKVYLETGNASEAYRQAYNASKMKENTIKSKASLMLKKGNIRATLNKTKKANSKRHDITIDKLTQIALDAISLGMEENPSIVAPNLGHLMRMHGHYTEKQEIKGSLSIADAIKAKIDERAKKTEK